MKSNVERFVELYKKLEEAVYVTYKEDMGDDDSPVPFLENHKKFKKYRDDIYVCRHFRNILNHTRKVDGNFVVEPSDKMISFVEALICAIKNRKRCKNIMINKSNTFWLPMTGKITEAMDKMKKMSYTHVPILEKGLVVGVFDENSLFYCLADKKDVSIDDSLTFEHIREYLSLDDRESEGFLFAKKNDYVDIVEERISDAFKKQRRIGMVIITETGDRNGRMQGIMTPWDIIASYKEG